MKLFRYLRRASSSLWAGIGGPLLGSDQVPDLFEVPADFPANSEHAHIGEVQSCGWRFRGGLYLDLLRGVKCQVVPIIVMKHEVGARHIGRQGLAPNEPVRCGLRAFLHDLMRVLFNVHGPTIQDAPQKRRGPFPLAFAGGKTK